MMVMMIKVCCRNNPCLQQKKPLPVLLGRNENKRPLHFLVLCYFLLYKKNPWGFGMNNQIRGDDGADDDDGSAYLLAS